MKNIQNSLTIEIYSGKKEPFIQSINHPLKSITEEDDIKYNQISNILLNGYSEFEPEHSRRYSPVDLVIRFPQLLGSPLSKSIIVSNAEIDVSLFRYLRPLSTWRMKQATRLKPWSTRSKNSAKMPSFKTWLCTRWMIFWKKQCLLNNLQLALICNKLSLISSILPLLIRNFTTTSAHVWVAHLIASIWDIGSCSLLVPTLPSKKYRSVWLLMSC